MGNGRTLALAAGLLAASTSAGAADLFGGYSSLRVGGHEVRGAGLALAWPLGRTLLVGAEATGQSGRARGEDLTEWAVLVGPVFAPWRGRRLSPFVQVRAGAVRSRRQVTVFGVAVGPEGVCDGGCPSHTGLGAEAGAGLDLRMLPRLALRLPQADYRFTGGEDDSGPRWRFSAGLVYRWGG
jgi:opacity protein-like surface antigen